MLTATKIWVTASREQKSLGPPQVTSVLTGHPGKTNLATVILSRMRRTDEELVKATLEGAPYAFEEIVERYQRLVFSIIYHYVGARDVVEDLAQEVFLKVFRSLATFDMRGPLKAWVSALTRTPVWMN